MRAPQHIVSTIDLIVDTTRVRAYLVVARDHDAVLRALREGGLDRLDAARTAAYHEHRPPLEVRPVELARVKNLAVEDLTPASAPVLRLAPAALLRVVLHTRQPRNVDALRGAARTDGDDDRVERAVRAVVDEPPGARALVRARVGEALACALDALDGGDAGVEARARFQLVLFPDAARLCRLGFTNTTQSCYYLGRGRRVDTDHAIFRRA